MLGRPIFHLLIQCCCSCGMFLLLSNSVYMQRFRLGAFLLHFQEFVLEMKCINQRLYLFYHPRCCSSYFTNPFSLSLSASVRWSNHELDWRPGSRSATVGVCNYGLILIVSPPSPTPLLLDSSGATVLKGARITQFGKSAMSEKSVVSLRWLQAFLLVTQKCSNGYLTANSPWAKASIYCWPAWSKLRLRQRASTANKGVWFLFLFCILTL